MCFFTSICIYICICIYVYIYINTLGALRNPRQNLLNSHSGPRKCEVQACGAEHQEGPQRREGQSWGCQGHTPRGSRYLIIQELELKDKYYYGCWDLIP